VFVFQSRLSCALPGGAIVRPLHAGPKSVATDKAQAALGVDDTIVDFGDVAKLCRAIARVAQGMIGGH